MHTNDARAMGETEQRIRALSGLARSAVLQRPGSAPRSNGQKRWRAGAGLPPAAEIEI